MNRRNFIALLGIVVIAWLPAHAQQPSKTWRIGYLAEAPRPPDDVFRQTLLELGYVEGKNLTTFYRWAEGNNYGPLAEDLVRLHVDVIVAVASPATRAAKSTTQTIPIVITAVGDPVAYGFIPSLAHPGGNITGVSAQLSEIGPKGLQFIKEIIPTATKVAVLGNEKNPGNDAMVTSLAAGASTVGLKTGVYIVQSGDLTTTFSTIARERPDALFVIPDHFLYTRRAQIIDFTIANRIPAVFGLKEYAYDGGLLTICPNEEEMFRNAGRIVDKVLKGAKPADLPVEQPTRFELFINLKTATALGLTIPHSLVVRADEVIE
jgi:putative tryptophan/tyrosine transport system substrate-binding protein